MRYPTIWPNKFTKALINSYSYPLDLCLAEPIPQILSLKYLLRFYIRKRLRSNWGLPQNIESRENVYYK